jgi:primosomal protein N' (replication factor Y)
MRARALRQSATRALAGAKFRRQHPIGPYIADFACIDAKRIIEANGGQHADPASDKHRTAWLVSEGWRISRFWTNDILKNPEGVMTEIQRALLPPAPSPSQR